MPRIATELSALAVRRLSKPGLHAVGGVAGLLLRVTDTGAKYWILRTTVGKKRRDIGIGPYPEISLAEARTQAGEMRQQIRQGIDPVAERQAARNALIAAQGASITFDEAARKYLEAKTHEFRSAKHAKQWATTLKAYASPVIGPLPVSDIELAHIVKILEPIWTAKTETAKRLRGRLENVLAWATVSGFRSGDNPARWRGNLDAILPKPSKVAKSKHFRALPWQQVPDFMSRLRAREAVAARALEFCILTAARSGEVRNATWDEFDLKERVWTVPAERIKAGKQHRVPLSDDALAVLKAMPNAADPGEDDYVFPAVRGGVMSDMALTALLRRMDVDATVHGFRSAFKDWARNRTNYADEVSELALAHVNSDATRAAYARDELLPQRARLMADWAKFCREGLPDTASVTSIGEAQ